MKTEKRCRDCEAVKPRDEFGVDWSHADGLKSWCRACEKARRKVRHRKAAVGVRSIGTTARRWD